MLILAALELLRRSLTYFHYFQSMLAMRGAWAHGVIIDKSFFADFFFFAPRYFGGAIDVTFIYTSLASFPVGDTRSDDSIRSRFAHFSGGY